jgi:signal transduction histidine kinase
LREVRFAVALSVVLICGSFASAAIIQMRNDHAHAMSMAAMFTERRAGELATDLAATLDRYRTIGTEFSLSRTNAETSATLAEIGGATLKNIAVLDPAGHLQSEMMGSPKDFLPLPRDVLAGARTDRTIWPSPDGRTIVLAFVAGPHIVAVQLDARHLVPSANMVDSVLAAPDGRAIAMGTQWRDVPGAAALALQGDISASRTVALSHGARLVSLKRAGDWPIVAGSSVAEDTALDAWYGALPLYLFFILGPAFAGAGLAVVLVRIFEQDARARASARTLRAKRPEEARLLVRLADAERRAVVAERAKSRFMAHVNHELRTPLNAIIGFSEVIEQGVFGTAGHPKYVEYAHDVGTAGRELHAKIGSILEFAEVEANRPATAQNAIDIAAIARQAIADAADTAQARSIQLIASLPERALANADAAAVERILGSLLANALQYTGAHGAVRVHVRREADVVVAGIRDTGPGFSKEEEEMAGTPFQRFRRPDAGGGMGLGLATATTLSRRMGGTLRLASAPGKGTLVELRLPVAPEG